MDIEQLKLILAALHDAGGAAFTFAIIWLAKDALLSLLLIGTLITVVILAYRLIARAVAVNQTNQDMLRMFGVLYYYDADESRRALAEMRAALDHYRASKSAQK